MKNWMDSAKNGMDSVNNGMNSVKKWGGQFVKDGISCDELKSAFASELHAHLNLISIKHKKSSIAIGIREVF